MNRFLPFFLLLVDFAQVVQRFQLVAAGVKHAAKQMFGPVEQAGLQVVPGQFQQGVGLGPVVQVRSCDQVLVQADGPLHLAAPAQQVSEHDVGFDGVGI